MDVNWSHLALKWTRPFPTLPWCRQRARLPEARHPRSPLRHQAQPRHFARVILGGANYERPDGCQQCLSKALTSMSLRGIAPKHGGHFFPRVKAPCRDSEIRKQSRSSDVYRNAFSAGPRSHRRCWPSRTDVCRRWPARLVATEAEGCIGSLKASIVIEGPILVEWRR